MKIFFINNATTHYYNLVLNKLSQLDDIELTLVVPSGISKSVGAGVHQTREGILFRVMELPEISLGYYKSMKGILRLVLKEKPDVIITVDVYLLTFVFHLPLRVVLKILGIKVIMKSIPFRLPTYQEWLNDIRDKYLKSKLQASYIQFLKIGLKYIFSNFILALRRYAYNVPDAHVNYVDDAFRVYGSYGVNPSKIFITRNSPDTDTLFAIRKAVEKKKPILPPNKHRIIHVGRLVEWKKVDMLIESFASVRKKIPDAELIIIGDGPESESLEKLAKSLKLSNSVRFIGGVYDPEILGQYLMSSSLYVLAGMGGLSINEAMCYGLPVICSVCDGTEKIIVRDDINGKYFIDGDVEDLTDKIVYILKNPKLMKKMGSASTEIIKKEVNISTVIQGYKKAIDYVTHT